MSISFNHPKNTMTSTSTFNLVALGGTPTNPRPIRLNASSVIMPNRVLPTGEPGAMVFDTSSKTMKYHDGISWVELQDAKVILQPIQVSLQDIYNKLGTKVDSVSYSSSTVPSASISGSTLNINFPLTSGSGGTGPSGLYTSSKPGSIMHYSLASGMDAPSIREQMGGIAGSQTGRNGTQALPFKTSDGWCFADGTWWEWIGPNGTIVKQVPNLNQDAYLKGMNTAGVTKIDAVVKGTARTRGTVLTVSQLPPLKFTVTGRTSQDGFHTHDQITHGSDKPGSDALTSSRGDWAGFTIQNIQGSGTHFHNVSGETNTLGSGEQHFHDMDNIDTDHYTTAILYNIAEGSVALSENSANSKYVLKSGDVMQGSLTIANLAAIQSDDTNLPLFFRNSLGGERAVIYHSSPTNTLRLRSAGGTDVAIDPTGKVIAPALEIANPSATVQGRNIVRSINNIQADVQGNVIFSAGVNGIQLGSAIQLGQGGWRGNYGGSLPGYVMTAYESYSDSRHLAIQMRPIQMLMNSVWYTISQI